MNRDHNAPPVQRAPRGRCPRCLRDVALRAGGLVREHRIPLPDGATETSRLPICRGGGEPGLPVDVGPFRAWPS
jgi:hypothetical protein